MRHDDLRDSVLRSLRDDSDALQRLVAARKRNAESVCASCGRPGTLFVVDGVWSHERLCYECADMLAEISVRAYNKAAMRYLYRAELDQMQRSGDI